MPLRHLIPALMSSFVIACGGEPFPPAAGSLIGTFGGRHLALSSDGRVAKVQLVCSFAVVTEPIVPDADGNFVVRQTPLVARTDSPVEVELRGRVVGDQILATLTTTTRFGPTREDVTLTRGRAGDFSDIACAAELPGA